MLPKRGRPPTMKNLNEYVTLATTSQEASIAAIREEIRQEFHVMMTEFRQQYLPPPQAPQPAKTHQPPLPVPAMPTSGNGLAYWEMLKIMRNMGMKSFNGGTDPIQADDWMKLLEKNFESTRCPTEFKKELAVNYLCGEAYIWWDNVVRSMRDIYEISWETFRLEFNKKYFPQEVKDSFLRLFLDLRQGAKTVREYEREFNFLRRFVEKEPSEQLIVGRFLRGLRPDIRIICAVREYTSMIELVEKAAIMEVELEEKAKFHEVTQAKMMNDARHVQGYIPRCAKCSKRHVGVCWRHLGKCMKCGEINHFKKNCRQNIDPCRNCGQRGHDTRYCRMELVEGRERNHNRGNMPPPPNGQFLGPRLFGVSNQDGVGSNICKSLS